MKWFVTAISTSVGKKGIMAVTGTILVLFVLVHMLGNTHLWEEPKEDGTSAMDFYAHLLRAFPGLLWAFRVVLLAVALTHVITGVILWLENQRARPRSYAYMRTVQASLASRTMIYTGVIVMGFIIYHLLHLTFGSVGPPRVEAGGETVLRHVVDGFLHPGIAVLYIVGQVLLFFHLSHGISSLLQTLGFRHPKYMSGVERGSVALAFVVCGMNILFPLSVLLGWVKL